MDAPLAHKNHHAFHKSLGKPFEISNLRSLELPVEIALGAIQQQIIGREHVVRIPPAPRADQIDFRCSAERKARRGTLGERATGGDETEVRMR